MIAAVAFILIGRASVFTVSEGQLAIKSTGGEIVDSNYAPGLHFKIPLVNEVTKFDRRILTDLYQSEHFLTREQEQLTIDFYVKWRIDNLRRYYETTGGSEDVANARLRETIRDSIKSVVTQRTLQQVVTAERAEFTDAMMKTARSSAEQLGIELVDVRITKIDLPQQVRIRCSSACARPSRRRRRSCAPRAWRRRTASAPRRTRSKPRSSPMRPGRRARRAGRAMPRQARSMRSRIRRTRSFTASIAACSPTGKRWARTATCW